MEQGLSARGRDWGADRAAVVSDAGSEVGAESDGERRRRYPMEMAPRREGAQWARLKEEKRKAEKRQISERRQPYEHCDSSRRE